MWRLNHFVYNKSPINKIKCRVDTYEIIGLTIEDVECVSRHIYKIWFSMLEPIKIIKSPSILSLTNMRWLTLNSTSSLNLHLLFINYAVIKNIICSLGKWYDDSSMLGAHLLYSLPSSDGGCIFNVVSS